MKNLEDECFQTTELSKLLKTLLPVDVYYLFTVLVFLGVTKHEAWKIGIQNNQVEYRKGMSQLDKVTNFFQFSR